MDPQDQSCHNPDCTARGQLGLGNIRVHGRKERRYRCTTCGRTFAATRDTPFYRLKKSADLVTLVITLLCHGCPVQAIVAAFGLDERTVADWRDRAGRHGQRFHEHRVLCQVAGHRMNVVKALPALVCDESDIRWFAEALEQVVARAERVPSAYARFMLTMAGQTLPRPRRRAAA